ncbi:HD domain-containing protein [Yimella sp. cx-573]|nr:HD domain-containing protein [Yimella sp. cx-573]
MITRGVLSTLVVIQLIAMTMVATHWSSALDSAGWRLGVMLLALALSVPLHLRLPSGLDASPVAPSIALAMALTALPTSSNAWLNTALVVIAVTAGTLLGHVVGRLLRQPPADVAQVTTRILSVAAAAVLYRNVPFVDGRSAASMVPAWENSGWRIALAMTACGAAAIVLDFMLLVLRTAPQGRLRETITHRGAEVGPVWLAVLGVAVGMALGFGPLDLWSVPIMAMPLLLMRTALRRQAAVVQVRRDTISALSRLPERTGFITEGHSRRVRMLGMRIGQQLMLTDREMRDLENAALLHDIGQLGLTEPIPNGATSDAAPTDQLAIAAAGAEVVRNIASLERVASIIEHQPTPYRNVREFGEELSVECRILKVCNAYDDLTLGRGELHTAAMERISLGMGYEYDPDVVDLLNNLPQLPPVR